ncbi:hypothetical protein KJ819_01895 [Patescibacteria group bacterium]|nr:hypothetical protein [Patescibacteria group bacterium]MBU1500964.1 hypothetical protein [Patescibacteria group bacterium]MBU2080594.1 hypothetical protein [Patescibacteria group bacterium]MBU2124331.1 hypothetical protein [Patescibacteria group bacterium]MBU2194457.1 hypothetical protein [Patescibacteria group bacterium]
MTIPGLIQRSKALLSRIPTDVLLVLVLLGAVSAAFGLGFQAGKDQISEEGKSDMSIEQFLVPEVPSGGGPAAAAAAPKATTGTYMASKNGTKYYLPTCSSSNRIKPENRVWFKTKAEAEAAGYGPAANCPGL